MQGREYESQIVTALVASSRKLWRFTKRFQQQAAASPELKTAAALRPKFASASELCAEIGQDKADVATLFAKTADLASHVEELKV